MAGNRAIFDRAMEQSREAARAGHWDESLKASVRALQEFSQDVGARTSAAVALFHTGKFDQALKAFEGLRAADPQNEFFLEYIARTQRQLGHVDDALAILRTLADAHESQQRTVQAIEAVKEMLDLRPDLDDQRLRLAKLYEHGGAKREAAGEYLILATRFQHADQFDQAAEMAEAALRLDPQSREAKDRLLSLRAAMARQAGIEVPDTDRRPGVSGQSAGTGMLRSQQFQVEKLIEQALKKQEAGELDDAVELYEQVLEAGVERADLFYSLGLLYQERGDHKAAVHVLNRAVIDAEYALSSHFALGTSYRELGQLPQAAQEFEQTIRLVDLQTIGRTEADDLISMYQSTATIYEEIGDIARASSLYATLASFLESKRWGRERAAEFKERSRELAERNMFAKLRTMGTGALTPQAEVEQAAVEDNQSRPESWGKIRPITDFLRNDRQGGTSALSDPVQLEQFSEPLMMLESLPAAASDVPATPLPMEGLADEVADWVRLSGKYLDQGLLEAALDACHDVIHLDTDYLPIHLRMGEIYERQDRPDDALTKYQLLIETYRLRGEQEPAIDVYLRYIELSPDTVNARSKLADLLKSVGRDDEAVAQLIQVANTYFRLAQTNKALEEYRRLLQWAPKNRDVHTQYGLALLKLERYEAALDQFHRALDLGEADDPLMIARLNMTLALMGDQPSAVWDSLATLVDQLLQQPQAYAAVQAEYRTVMLVVDTAILHYILGIIQQQAGQHASALLELEQAQTMLDAEVDPLLPPVLVHQAAADSHIALGDAAAALEQLQRGLAVAGRVEVDPGITHSFARPLTKGELVRLMAEAHAASDDLVGAEQALREAKKLLPYDRAVYTKLADVYFRQGHLTEALAQLEELAGYYEERQQLDRAIEMLAYALKLAPNHIAISSRLARMQLRRGFLDKGVEGLIRASELQRKAGQLKDAVTSLQEAAQVHWTLGEQEKAREVYDRILQIAPHDVEARQWLALMHTLASRTPDAIAEKKRIAMVFAQQQDYDNAIAELHQVIGLDQTDLDAYYMLGDMLMRREEYSQAVQLYNRMLKMETVDTERVEALLSAASRLLQQRQSNRQTQE
jgi:tetratricopeptide (TPR) repeat protein